MIVAKQGEYGAALVTRENFFALPAYPLENVIDPTGAGDTFAGGLVGYIAHHRDGRRPRSCSARDGPRHRARLLQRRGVRDRANRALSGHEIVSRIKELHAMTQFSGAPLALLG